MSKTVIPVARRNAAGAVIIGPDGRPAYDLKLDPLKLYTKDYVLASEPLNVTLAPKGTTGDSETLEFLVDEQGHFDWMGIVGSTVQAYAIEFYDPSLNRKLQNAPVHANNIVGSGARPFLLPEPYFLNVGNGKRVIQCKVQNLTGDSNFVQLELIGRRFYHNEAPPGVHAQFLAQFADRARTYSYFLLPSEADEYGQLDPIPAGQTVRYRFTAESDADTVVLKRQVVTTTDPLADFDFTLTERQTGRQLMTGPVSRANGWGNSEFPFFLKDSYLLERKKDLFLDVTNTSGSPIAIYPTLSCVRVYAEPFI